MSYSVYGSSDFEAMVDKLLKSVVDEFLSKTDLSKLSALVLGGGYGRGEGGVFRHDGIEELYNDLDLFVFTKPMNLISRRKLKHALNHLHQLLSSEHGIDIDFSIPMISKSLPATPISQMYYDLRYGHKVLWGNPHLLHALPGWSAQDIPRMEALRLLLNRGIGLYLSQRYLAEEDPACHADFINRNICKALQATAEAIMIDNGKYESSVVSRMRILQDTNLESYSGQVKLKAEILKAMEFKLMPYIPDFDAIYFEQKLNYATAALKDVYYTLWSKELCEPISDGSTLINSIKRGIRDFKIRNVALNLRDKSLNQISSKDWFRYPRFRLHMAMPWMVFGEEMDNQIVSGILGTNCSLSREGLEQRFMTLWKRYN